MDVQAGSQLSHRPALKLLIIPDLHYLLSKRLHHSCETLESPMSSYISIKPQLPPSSGACHLSPAEGLSPYRGAHFSARRAALKSVKAAPPFPYLLDTNRAFTFMLLQQRNRNMLMTPQINHTVLIPKSWTSSHPASLSCSDWMLLDLLMLQGSRWQDMR